MNQYLPEWLAVKVSYIQVGAKCDHVIFTSSGQRSLIRWGNPILQRCVISSGSAHHKHYWPSYFQTFTLAILSCNNGHVLQHPIT
jgi:hypothetical protein